MRSGLGPLGRPAVIGHRGARGHAPENSMAAFEKGAALGADLVECDVHLSRDGQVVVIHDETVDRTTSKTGRVQDLTADDLAHLDLGDGRGVPRLADLLAWVARQAGEGTRGDPGALGIVVEIKNGPVFYPDIAVKVVAAIAAASMIERTMVISFDHLAVREAKVLCPELATGILYHARLVDPVSAARSARADSIWPSIAMLTPEVVREAHAAGLGAFTWTANTLAEIDRALDSGVDGAGSDYPDRLALRIKERF